MEMRPIGRDSTGLWTVYRSTRENNLYDKWNKFLKGSPIWPTDDWTGWLVVLLMLMMVMKPGQRWRNTRTHRDGINTGQTVNY